MKVKFKTVSAGANGVIYPGDIIDVSDSEAKILADGGYAEYAEPRPVQTPPPAVPKPAPSAAAKLKPKTPAKGKTASGKKKA